MKREDKKGVFVVEGIEQSRAQRSECLTQKDLLDMLCVSSEAENGEPQPQNKSGKHYI
jgi:hypothetical protein